MKYGVCQVSVAPLRAKPSDTAEMVTQLLFGEKVEIQKTQKKWWYVCADYDSYEGWIDPKQLLEVEPDEYIKMNECFCSSENFNLLVMDNTPMTLPQATILPNLNEGKGAVANKTFDYLGASINTAQNTLTIPDIALSYINVPYLWGGKSHFGIDCSGFVQQVYKMKNIKLPRDASQQAKIGEVLGFVAEAQEGDLAFFDNEEGEIIHVGIILSGQKIIHAHGKVRIDPLDSNGIFNTDSQKYSHKLRFVKRIS